MKNAYETPAIQVVSFECEDVIRTSNTGEGIEL